MMPTPSPAKIDLSKAEIAGDPKAPVTVTMYLCARCPFCAKLTPWLYKEVTEGKLKGKVRLALRLYPIKGHEGSVESGLAAMAAYKQQKAFAFLLHAYSHFDRFSIEGLPQWAEAVGMDMDAYKAAVEDPATREELIASKKEGIANKVKATPTLFINGRMYRGDMDQEMLIDVFQEEFERVTGKQKES
jgi:protein-disulfide isomerase